jgi:hypothetical protein
VKFLTTIRKIFRTIFVWLIQAGTAIELGEAKDLDGIHDYREKIKKERNGKRS